ncbi:TPA: helix-turn-helix transcriptional regulator, partial [Listeria monocytogenes]|nr:XRE family transcriptional regulator [Listeria monocytogenes]EAE2142840.1 XRE family transcriptional regulator [Listeria monocytogenes]EAE2334782.1 XRE family transcriptional regulator [Listeria monocytogenes]EAE6290351.1 XRE family transcriptional regulator [Listeria monocytogenes]EAF0484953.1 XRE family transcriptional regulator [Listeria monocytogenes]
AENLSRLKKEHGLKNHQIAELLNVQTRTVAYYMSGETKPDIEKLIRLATYFHLSIDELVGYVQEDKVWNDLSLKQWLLSLNLRSEEEIAKIKILVDTVETLYPN